MKTQNRSRLLLGIMVGLWMTSPALAQVTQLPHSFTFDGMVYNSDTTPLVDAAASIKVQVYNPGETCLLFEETHTANITNGHFAIKVGTGTRALPAVDGGINWPMIFKNDSSQVRSHDSGYCSGGYTPANMDGRKMRVTVNGNVMTPSFDMAPVPMATVAETLMGKSLSEFVTTSGGVTLSGSLTMPSVKVANGGYYVSLQAPSLSGNVTLTLPNSVGSPGQVLKTDGSGNLAWQADNDSGGGGGGMNLNGLTDPAQTFAIGTSGTAPAFSSGSSVHTLNIPMASTASVTAGLISKTDYDSFNAKLTNVAGSTLADGQTWVGNGSNMAVVRYFGVGDLKNNVGAQQFPASCSSSQTMTWSAVTDVFACTNISGIAGSNITNAAAGNIAATSVQSAINELDAEKLDKSGGSMTGMLTLPLNGFHIPNQLVTVNNGVGIGTNTIESSAILQVDSTTRGFLPPRMNTVQRDAIVSPATGLQIFNSTTFETQYYDGSMWRTLQVAGAGPGIYSAGNLGTPAGPAFTFNSDGDTGIYSLNDALGFTTGGMERAKINSTGFLMNPTSAQTIGSGPMGSAIAGTSLTLKSADAGSGASNANGGALLLSAGGSTGTGFSRMEFRTAKGASGGSTPASPVMRMEIDQNGSVNILKTNLPEAFQIISDDGPVAGRMVATSDIAGDMPKFYGFRKRLTAGGVQNNDALFMISAHSDGSSGGGAYPAARIGFYADANALTNANPGRIEFQVTDNGGTANTLAMVIKNNGNIGIGSANPTEKLRVMGEIRAEGVITSKSYTYTGGTNAVDWAMGNTITTDFDCGSAIAFSNMRDGGVYTLVVTGPSTTVCNFSGTLSGVDAGSVTYKRDVTNGVRTASSHTVYELRRIGAYVYVSWKSYAF